MHKLRRPGNLLLLALLAGAVVASIWLADGRPWAGGPAPLLNFLGRLAGVVGFVMMLIAAAVSIRIPGFDQPFGGLTELWKTHHVLGAGAFLLLLLHPVLMALANLPVSPQAPARLLIPTSIENWLGWGALIAMMVFLAPTFHFFGRPHYQIWKGIHSISALALILGAAHTLMWARTLPAWLWSAVTAVALGALAFRLVYRKLHPGRRFTIKKVVPLADRVVEVSMVPENGPPITYTPVESWSSTADRICSLNRSLTEAMTMLALGVSESSPQRLTMLSTTAGCSSLLRRSTSVSWPSLNRPICVRELPTLMARTFGAICDSFPESRC